MIVVDDNSPDGTQDVVRQLQQAYGGERIVRHTASCVSLLTLPVLLARAREAFPLHPLRQKYWFLTYGVASRAAASSAAWEAWAWCALSPCCCPPSQSLVVCFVQGAGQASC